MAPPRFRRSSSSLTPCDRDTLSVPWQLWTWVGLLAATLSACSASRTETLGCATARDCDDGEACRAGQCTSTNTTPPERTTFVSAVGRVEGAPGMVTIEADRSCKQGEESSCTVAPGDQVVLHAPLIEGFRFTGWSGDKRCAGSEPTLTLELAKDVSCVAKYVATRRVEGVVAESDAPVEAASEAEFSACGEGACVVDQGAEVLLTAPRRDGFRLRGWEGDGCEQAADYTVRVLAADADVTCTATYAEALTVRGEVSGVKAVVSARSEAAEGDCGVGLCAVVEGAAVTLSAPEVPKGRFTGWTGEAACASSEREVTLADVRSNVLCVANYVPRATVRGVAEGVPRATAIVATSNDAFADCTSETCEVDEGDTVSLQAPSVAGYRLQAWAGVGCARGRGASTTVTDAKGDITCTATYVEGVAVSGTVLNADGEVIASSSQPGADCADGRCAIAKGGSVRLVAPSLPDRTFVGWDGDPGCTATTPTIELVDVQESVTCNARFAARYTVTGKASPSSAGSVRASATSTTARCTEASCTVDDGQSVTLNATANADTRFTGWSGGGGCTGSSVRLELSRVRVNQTCTANFVARVQVTVSANPSAGGRASVTALSTGASCSGNRCTIDSGTDATLSAQASSGYRFTGWSGCTALGSGVAQLVSVRRDAECVANFERLYQVSAIASPSSGGRVTAAKNGVDCGGSCQVSSDDTVKVEARPSTGYDFDGFSGCTGSGTTATVSNVSGNVTCTARFTPKTYPVTVETDHPEWGSATGPSSVTHGSSVTLTARPSGYNVVLGWDCAGNTSGNSLTISNVTGPVHCTARLALRYRVNLVERSTSARCATIVVQSTTGTCDSAGTCLVAPGGSVVYSFRPTTQPCFMDMTCPYEGSQIFVSNVNQSGTCTWQSRTQ